MKSKTQIHDEALQAIGINRRSGIEVSMGIGKTLIGLRHIAAQYTEHRRYLVVAPRRPIFQAWKDEMKKFGYEYLESQIEFSTYLSLSKQSYDYDFVYLDECHSLKSSHNRWLYEYLSQGGRVLGMTGTYPHDRHSEKGKMCNFYCPLVYSYSPDEAISDEILNDYKIIVHELQLSNKPTLEKTKSDHITTYTTSELKDYTYWCERIFDSTDREQQKILRIQRMKALQTYPGKFEYAKLLFEQQTEKTIIFTNTQHQADEICTNSYHSNNPKSKGNLDRFKTDKILKLSAVEQLSEGVTIPHLKVGIIMHAYSNNRRASQKIGRMLRLNPTETATIHILCYANSVDKEWVTNALKGFNEDKIQWIKAQFYGGIHY